MTYKTDCFRKIADEDGTVTVKRWVEDRTISLTIVTDPATGNRFWRGYRVGGAA
jgi:hypothetical protein